jgi:hypothetical protein
MNSFFAPILFIQFLFLLASCNSTKTTTIEFSDGSYQGEIDKKGKKNGKGIYVWHDGSTYEGDFKEDSRHGNGYFKWRNGESYKGDYFENGRTGEGQYRWPDGSYYEGSFLRGKRHGTGIYYSIDGAVYEGEWFDDLQHGEGILTNPNKTITRAVWRNGKIITQPAVLPKSANKPILEVFETPPVGLVKQIPLEIDGHKEVLPPGNKNEINQPIEPTIKSSVDRVSSNQFEKTSVEPNNQLDQKIVPPTHLHSKVSDEKIRITPQVKVPSINPLPLIGTSQPNSKSSNIWTGTVDEAEEQFITELVNGIDTVSDAKSKKTFSGKMQILNQGGALIGEVNLLNGQLHGEEIFIDEIIGIITEKNVWEKGVRVK